MWKPRGVWDECLTCSCDGQLWVHLSASKRNTWCESRRVTRDARVVARDAFKRARQHLWPMSLLCGVETRPLWRHTFLTSSHIPWQISQMMNWQRPCDISKCNFNALFLTSSHISWQISQIRKWRGESDISKCNFNAMRQNNHIFGVVPPGAMNLLLVIVHVRFMSMSGRHQFHGLSPLYVWWPVPLREVCVWWATREIEEGGKLLNQVSPLPSDILHIWNVK